MAKGKVTDEKINLIFRLMEICKNQYKVAKAVDLSQGTVQKILAARMIEQNRKAEEARSNLFNIDSYSKTIVTI